MRGMVLVIALGAIACIRTGTTTCDDGTLCPDGTQCHAVAATGTTECVTGGQLAACKDAADGTECPSGTCYSGACLPAGCGNRRLDRDEACDDGDLVSGNGCSADCRSNESCGNAIVDAVRSVDGVSVANEQCDDGGRRSHDGCSSTCRGELPTWSTRPIEPSLRSGARMVTETRARRIVLFGGTAFRGSAQATEFFSDTWERGRDSWRRLRTSLAPTPRARHAMAYDGERTILFGGDAGERPFGDTWELVANTWSLIPTAANAPPSRRDHAMAFMPGVGIVLFGGSGADASAMPLQDTWVFANGSWSEISAVAGTPTARTGAAMVYDPKRDRIVLAAGRSSTGYVRDTWEFDGTRWMTAGTSPPVDGPFAAFDRERGVPLLHGGFGPSQLSVDEGPPVTQAITYAWDGATWTAVPERGPERYDGASATDPATGQLVIFGGTFTVTDGTCPIATCDLEQNEVFRLSTRWEQVSRVPLPSLPGAAAAYDFDRGAVVVFGGRNGATQSNVTFEVSDGDGWRATAAPGPSARSVAALAYGPLGTGRATILHGGRTGLSTSDELWRWDGTTWALLAPAVRPSARSNHAMAYDTARNRLVLFGGRASTEGFLGDTWEWDGASWQQLFPPSAPRARRDHAMAYDPIAERVLLFGGVNESAIGDLWAWDGTTWELIQRDIAPSARADAAMAWDAGRSRMVLFGSETSDTWEWDGDTWSFASVLDRPRPQAENVLVSAPSGSGVIAIGGRADDGSGALGDPVLYYSYESTSPYAACRGLFDDDRDGQLGCADEDCLFACTPGCPPGSTCPASFAHCGDGICSPIENCSLCPSDCTCTAPCGDFVCEPGETASCPGDC